MAFGGNWLITALSRPGDRYMTIPLLDAFILFPLMSLGVGLLVGGLQERWWLAGICLLPLIGYWLGQAAWDGFVIKSALIYVAICTGSAFVAMRLRRRREGTNRQPDGQV
jgi:hypothetical protein